MLAFCFPHTNSTPNSIAPYAWTFSVYSANWDTVISVVLLLLATTSPLGSVMSSHRPNSRAKYSCQTSLENLWPLTQACSAIDVITTPQKYLFCYSRRFASASVTIIINVHSQSFPALPFEL